MKIGLSETVPVGIQGVVFTDPEILGGAVCFVGTRVPLSTFLDHVELGISVDDFLLGYSGVTRAQVSQILTWMSEQTRKTVGISLAS